MGEAEASEPELPPAYVAVHRAFRRLTEVERAHRRRQAAEGVLAVEFERVTRLRAQLERELEEAEAAERRAERPSLQSRRRRRDRVAAERADVTAVRAELMARQQAWEELSMGLGPASGVDPEAEVEAARAELEQALAAWQQAHQLAGTALGQRLEVLERRAGEVAALIREVDDVIVASGQAERSLLDATAAVIESPTVGGPLLPTGLGSGVPFPFIGRRTTRVETAVDRRQRWLLHLDAELADLNGTYPSDLAPPEELVASIRRWLDDADSSRLLFGQVEPSLTVVADCRELLLDLRARLRDYREFLADVAARAADDRRTALLEHPGVL